MKKGEQKVPEEEILDIIRREDVIKPSQLKNELRKRGYPNLHYYTARKYLRNLEEKELLIKKTYQNKKYTIEIYRLSLCEGECEENDNKNKRR